MRAVAFAYGDGPVFVGLGTSDGVVRYTVDTQKHGGWYYYKTLWAIAPGYTGSVVITGRDRKLERAAAVQRRRVPWPAATQVALSAGYSGKWRYGPSDTLIRAAGCYLFHIEGDDFEQSIAFRATN